MPKKGIVCPRASQFSPCSNLISRRCCLHTNWRGKIFKLLEFFLILRNVLRRPSVFFFQCVCPLIFSFTSLKNCRWYDFRLILVLSRCVLCSFNICPYIYCRCRNRDGSLFCIYGWGMPGGYPSIELFSFLLKLCQTTNLHRHSLRNILLCWNASKPF